MAELNEYESDDSSLATFADNIVTLYIDDDVLNSASALEKITDSILDADADQRVRAVVLQLRGTADKPHQIDKLPAKLADRQPKGSQGPAPIMEQAALETVFTRYKPHIAVLQDKISGVLLDLSAACDIRVANESMILCDKRVMYGEPASTGISYILPKLIGSSQAMRILLLGDKLDAKEALRIHFLHRVYDDESFEQESSELIKSIAKMATRAWEVHKMQVLGQMHLDFDSAMVHSLGIRQTHVINDRQEGIKSWREKREPKFTGT